MLHLGGLKNPKPCFKGASHPLSVGYDVSVDTYCYVSAATLESDAIYKKTILATNDMLCIDHYFKPWF